MLLLRRLGGGSRGALLRVPTVRSSSSSGGGVGGGSLLDRVRDLTDHDVEKELFKTKRAMGAYYSKGQYADALHCAVDLETAIEQLMGRQTSAYASALNNVALMNKMLGNADAATDKYTQSLVIYEAVVGRKHASYAATLTNLGILYREQAAAAKGMDKEQLLARAEEALSDAVTLRLEVSGPSHKDTLTARHNLAALFRLTGREKQAETLLREALATARASHGSMDAITAQALNALGLLLKSSQVPSRRAEARRLYEEALNIRSSTLGDAHPDTIVSMVNLAELLMGGPDPGPGSGPAPAPVPGSGPGSGPGPGHKSRQQQRQQEREERERDEEDKAEARRLQARVLAIVERIKAPGGTVAASAAASSAASSAAPDASSASAPAASTAGAGAGAGAGGSATSAGAKKKETAPAEPPPFTYATRRKKGQGH